MQCNQKSTGLTVGENSLREMETASSLQQPGAGSIVVELFQCYPLVMVG